MKSSNSDKFPEISIPQQALNELAQVQAMDIELNLDELVEWVNMVIDRFYPKANKMGDKRVSDRFTSRTIRYYQTSGCLDSPHKKGRKAMYGFRHCLQALLIRKMLYLKCSIETIRDSLKDRTITQYKDLLFNDITIVSAQTAQVSSKGSRARNAEAPCIEHWRRLSLHPCIELNLKVSTDKLTQTEQKKILAMIRDEIKQL